MSYITSDWTPIETEAPILPSLACVKTHGRKEEFRAALDGYMADYRKHRAAIGKAGYHTRSAHFPYFLRFAEWLRR